MNVVGPPSNPASATPPTSDSNTMDEMFEATLAKHFASFRYETHHLPSKPKTPTQTLISSTFPQRPASSTCTWLRLTKLWIPLPKKLRHEAQVLIELVFDTSSDDSFAPPFTPFYFKPTSSIILQDLIPFNHSIPSSFPYLDTFLISLIAKITLTRYMNAQILNPNDVST